MMQRNLKSQSKEFPLTATRKKELLNDANKQLACNLGWEIVDVTITSQELNSNFDPTGFLNRRNTISKNQAAAVLTALNTYLFGGYGDAKGLEDKHSIEEIKQKLDGVASNTLGKLLYFSTNDAMHLKDKREVAYIVFQGEGAAEKAGSAAGSPNLGHGRIYALPKTAKRIETIVNQYLTDLKSSSEGTKKNAFQKLIKNIEDEGVHIVSIVVDTLENTSRSAKGEKTGPMTVIHFVEGALITTKAYESYGLTMTLSKEVAKHLNNLDFDTPLEDVVRAIRGEYPHLKPSNIYVYTLGGSDRVKRLGDRWQEWNKLGVHLVTKNDNTGPFSKTWPAFIESGSYAPNYMVGHHVIDGKEYYVINDGYAAQAEAVQGLLASYASGKRGMSRVILPKFFLPFYPELEISKLDPADPDLEQKLITIYNKYKDKYKAPEYAELEYPTSLEKLNKKVQEKTKYSSFVEYVRTELIEIQNAGYKQGELLYPQNLLNDPKQKLSVVAMDAFIGDDPYSGNVGIMEIEPGKYAVNIRTSVSGFGSFMTKYIIKPIGESLDVPRRRAIPIIDTFLDGYRTVKDFIFKDHHAALVKYNLRDAYYDASLVTDAHTYVYKNKIIAMLGEHKGRKVLAILQFLKEMGGEKMKWLKIEED